MSKPIKIEVELQDTMGSDESIANAAWTSTYDKSKREEKYDDPDKVAALVKRLATDGHQVPFESVILRFWIRMPIMTDRQHMTHRIASHNGLSGRYRTMPDDWLPMPDDVKKICEKMIDTSDGASKFMGKVATDAYDKMCKAANEEYRMWVEALKETEKNGKIDNAQFKRAREWFRGMLPVGGMIERTTIVNLVSFANYQRLRNSKHAQPEVRQVARLMLREVLKAKIAPAAMEILMEKGFLIAEPNKEFTIAGDDE